MVVFPVRLQVKDTPLQFLGVDLYNLFQTHKQYYLQKSLFWKPEWVTSLAVMFDACTRSVWYTIEYIHRNVIHFLCNNLCQVNWHIMAMARIEETTALIFYGVSQYSILIFYFSDETSLSTLPWHRAGTVSYTSKEIFSWLNETKLGGSSLGLKIPAVFIKINLS